MKPLGINEVLETFNAEYRSVNSIVTRRMNVVAVMQFLYTRGEETVHSIATGTGLSIPTVSSILKRLTERGITFLSSRLQSSGGRRPAAYAVNYNACCSIGIDISQTRVKIVILNLNAEIIARDHRAVEFEDSFEYWEKIKALADSFRQEHQPPGSEFLGVGFSLPCHFERDDPKAVQLTYGMKIERFDLSHMYALFGDETYVMNNGALAGISAVWNKYIKNSVAYVMLNNEIAGTISPIRQSLVLGPRAGEFGHMTLVPGGKLCSCGREGCLEAYCSASVLSRESGVELEAFFEGVARGNKEYRNIWDAYLDYLAIFINSLRMALDCDVMIGGIMSTYIRDFEQQLRDKINRMNFFGEECDYLAIARYGKYDSCVGAGIRLVAYYLSDLGVDN